VEVSSADEINIGASGAIELSDAHAVSGSSRMVYHPGFLSMRKLVCAFPRYILKRGQGPGRPIPANANGQRRHNAQARTDSTCSRTHCPSSFASRQPKVLTIELWPDATVHFSRSRNWIVRPISKARKSVLSSLAAVNTPVLFFGLGVPVKTLQGLSPSVVAQRDPEDPQFTARRRNCGPVQICLCFVEFSRPSIL